MKLIKKYFLDIDKYIILLSLLELIIENMENSFLFLNQYIIILSFS